MPPRRRLHLGQARFGYAITPCSIGGPNRYGPPNEGILIDGVAKLDLRAGGVRARWQAPDGFYLVSEPTFVPKAGSAPGDGDAGDNPRFRVRPASVTSETHVGHLGMQASSSSSSAPRLAAARRRRRRTASGRTGARRGCMCSTRPAR